MQDTGFTPGEAVGRMMEGNRRFTENTAQHPHQDQERRIVTSAQGQNPFAVVLSCADSRVPVEVICDRGVGDLFVVRVAGNVLGMNELGSVEYAVEHLGTPTFVVLGHKGCGAIKAVVEAGLLEGNLKDISERIFPSVSEVRKNHPALAHDALVNEVARLNVWKTIEEAFRSSEIIRKKVSAQELELVGALYDIESGKIEWMGTHFDQPRLLG